MERPLLLPFVPLYRLGLAFDRWRRARDVYRSSRPVLSVGSITAGGAGKTPLVRWLVEYLQEHVPVIVLSRGYGRSARGSVLWHAGDPLPDPAVIGDEPAMLARSLRNGSVAVGSNRRELLRSLDQAHVPGIAILDDGFQHWPIHRDLDLVLLTAETFSSSLLPAGNRREPLGALRRADLLLSYEPGVLDAADRYLGGRGGVGGALELRTEGVYALDTGERIELGGDVVLVTGIARPERVVTAVERMGLRVAEHLIYRDHVRYTPSMVREIERRRRERGGGWIVTTEKDAVKLEQATGEIERVAYLKMATAGGGLAKLRSVINPLLQ